ncbi:UNVERIFIED_ORG: hypothetical protein J2806_000476 [Kosakonia oryzae]|uniref:hypothetical protein n=1 Tax=Kosakonia TaxID=1330547 RepID=UPI00116074BF|nr:MULTISPECIES: hypothetical protein [Kosakonia]MDP9564843.1 hypothetical protein [Kosakonia oryzae]
MHVKVVFCTDINGPHRASKTGGNRPEPADAKGCRPARICRIEVPESSAQFGGKVLLAIFHLSDIEVLSPTITLRMRWFLCGGMRLTVFEKQTDSLVGSQ